MIRILTPKSDFKDLVPIDAAHIKKILYYTHLDGTKVEPVTEVIQDDLVLCKIDSSVLGTMKTGIIIREIQTVYDDAQYLDGTYDSIQSVCMNYWLNNEVPVKPGEDEPSDPEEPLFESLYYGTSTVEVPTDDDIESLPWHKTFQKGNFKGPLELTPTVKAYHYFALPKKYQFQVQLSGLTMTAIKTFETESYRVIRTSKPLVLINQKYNYNII